MLTHSEILYIPPGKVVGLTAQLPELHIQGIIGLLWIIVESAGLDLMFLGSKEDHIIWRTKGTVKRNSDLWVRIIIIYIIMLIGHSRHLHICIWRNKTPLARNPFECVIHNRWH